MANAQTMDVPIRIAVVDDDENIRLWFKDILQPTKTFNLTGSFSNATEALEEIPRLQPDITLMDIRMPGLNGIECTRRLKQAMPRLKIIMVTGTHEQDSVSASLHAGATTFLIKPLEGDQLLATLRFAAANLKESRTGFNGLAVAKPNGRHSPLSPREKEVMAGLAEGLLYKEISGKLGISYAAVHKYQHSIFKKLRATNRSEAARIWLNSQG